jgi:hypothetical protein
MVSLKNERIELYCLNRVSSTKFDVGAEQPANETSANNRSSLLKIWLDGLAFFRFAGSPRRASFQTREEGAATVD